MTCTVPYRLLTRAIVTGSRSLTCTLTLNGPTNSVERMLSIDMLTMFSPLSSVRSALYACISTLCGALSCLRGAPSVQGSIHGLCIHFYYSRCYSVMFRPIMLVPMFRLVPGYPLVLPRSRYVPECITRSVLCSGVVRPRYLGRERRLVVLIVWGLTLCRRRSRFVVVPCSQCIYRLGTHTVPPSL